MATSQLTLELNSSLLTRYRSLRECVYHSVLNDARGMKAVAADCDISVSELSRRLSPTEGDPRSLDADLMVAIIESTKDLTPVHWLMAKFFQDQEAKRRAAVDQITQLMPQLVALLAEASGPSKRKG